MTVTYVIRYDVHPDKVDRFLGLLDTLLDAMRKEETFREAILHRAPDHGHRFMLYETWADHQEVRDVQIKRPYRQPWNDALPDLLAAPRDISMWTAIRTDRPGADAG